MSDKTLAESVAVLNIAWVRLYCAAVPKAYRRSWLRHALGWGPVGAVIFITEGGLLHALDAFMARRERSGE